MFIVCDLPFFEQNWHRTLIDRCTAMRAAQCRDHFQKMFHLLDVLFGAKMLVQLTGVHFFAWLLCRSGAHQIAERLDGFGDEG